MEDVDFAPYFQYQCILDGRTRPEHKALHGKVFRYDDPFWQTMYPPNGWNCRCFVTSLSDRDLARKGLKVESSEGKLKEVSTIVGGEEKTITAYDFSANGKNFRLKPDAGWDTNLGNEVWNMDVLAYSKIQNLPQPIKDKFISDMVQNVHNEKAIVNLINKTIKRGYKSRGEELPLTWFTPNIINYLEKNNIKLKTPVVVFEDRQVYHSLSERKVSKQKLTEPQFLQINEIIKNPDETLLDTEQLAIIYVKFLPKSEIINNRDCIKIQVQINTNKNKRPINYIGTTARVNYNNSFNNTRYKKIE